ncbi:receptor like protein 27-like [Carex rostrata]
MVLYICILNIFKSSTASNCLAYTFSPAMVLFALLSLSLLFSFSTKNRTLTQAQCLPDQRDALIQLKQGFITTELHSWNASTDCCIWDGIKCDKQIGMVTAVNLASCSISGEINLALFSLSSLRYLNLSGNNFYNLIIPQIGFERLANLTHLNLSDSGFIGQVPIGICALTNLISLDLSYNYLNLRGTGLKTLLSNLTKLQLLCLDLVDISINGSEWGKAVFQVGPTLQQLAMGRCGLSGNFPDGIFHLTNLTKLDLSYNPMLSSQLPDSIGNLQNLAILDLEHCGLYGVIPPSITNITRLKDLNLGANKLTGPVPLLFPPTIQFADFSFNYLSWPAYFLSIPIYLSLSENKLTGEIPLSLCNVTSPKFIGFDHSSKTLPRGLDLSFNNITGTMPPCLLEHAESYEVLNLQSNNLSGPLPRNINQECKLVIINLSGNRINGSLPQSLLNCDTLQILDLGNNQIVDRFPFRLGTLRNLRVLVLRSNQFYGPISNMEVKTKTNNSIFPTLQVFDVSSNHFSGIISKTFFENLKAMVSNSNSTGFEMGYSGHYYESSIKVIWKGQEMEIIRSLSIFSSLDLSENKFSGEIPEDIGQLRSLDVLNLSHNTLIGPIPSEFGNLQQLESLDLSCNQLSGHIPQELTSLTFLSALNLSYNNMVGEIPQGHQFSTFLNNSYLGNPGLCGSPLSMQCATTPSNDGFNKDLPSKSYTNIIELSISIGLGLGVGFASVICALLSWENGREQFNFIVDRFYFQHIPWIVLHLRLAIGRE